MVTTAFDNVVPSSTPHSWNLPVLFAVSVSMASVSCLSSLVFLWMCLDSHQPTGVFATLGLSGLSYGQITTAIFLKISIAHILAVFCARNHATYMWQPSSVRPSVVLSAAALVALAISSSIACLLPQSYPDDVSALGIGLTGQSLLPLYIWIYCILFWFVQVKMGNCFRIVGGF